VGFRGTLWDFMRSAGFLRFCCGLGRAWYWDSLVRGPVDKSVTSESLPLEIGKSRNQGIKVMGGAAAKLVGADEVGVGDHHGLPFADVAIGDQPVSTDAATAEEHAGRDRHDAISGERPSCGAGDIRRVQAQTPMAKQTGV